MAVQYQWSIISQFNREHKDEKSELGKDIAEADSTVDEQKTIA